MATPVEIANASRRLGQTWVKAEMGNDKIHFMSAHFESNRSNKVVKLLSAKGEAVGQWGSGVLEKDI